MLDHSSHSWLNHFPSPIPPVVPIIPVVIPMAVDLSDAVSDDLVVRRPIEENGQVTRPGL